MNNQINNNDNILLNKQENNKNNNVTYSKKTSSSDLIINEDSINKSFNNKFIKDNSLDKIQDTRKECQISNNFNKDINSSDNLCPKNNDNNNNNEKIFFYRPFENTHNNKEKEVILGIQKYKTENSSNTTKSNKSKSLFIINEVLTKEKKDEENKIESQDSLLIKKRGRKQIKKKLKSP